MTMIEASEEGQRRRIPITPLLRPADVLARRALPPRSARSSTARWRPASRGRWRWASTSSTASGWDTAQPAPELDGDAVASWDHQPFDAVPDFGNDVARRPFAGLRVLDFGVAGAAPEIARLLGEYGADVIRVESPHRPDLFRQLGGPSGMSPVFASSSRTKRSFGVDFRDGRGVALIKQLAARADLVVENLPPGTMDSYGLGCGRPARRQPRGRDDQQPDDGLAPGRGASGGGMAPTPSHPAA